MNKHPPGLVGPEGKVAAANVSKHSHVKRRVNFNLIIRLEAIAMRMEAIASRLEAIAIRLEAIASRLKAITIR